MPPRCSWRSTSSSPGPRGEGGRRRAVDAAREHASLLRSHVHEESYILHPLAEAHLSAEAMAGVNEACDAFERRGGGRDLLRLAGEPARRDLPPGG